jgi:hypothetical protein
MNFSTKAVMSMHLSSREAIVKKNARLISSNKDLMAKHLWRTKPCRYGLNCTRMETCCGAHFKCEYRTPDCLHMEFCDKGDSCTFYHAHFGTVDEYMKFMGIEFLFNTPEEWMENTKKLQEELDQKMKELSLKIEEKEKENKKEKEEKDKKKDLLRPLTCAPKIVNNAIVEKNNHPLSFTRFCKHMKEDNMCTFSGCTFAHSIEQLVLQTCDKSGCGCNRLHKSDDKIKVAENLLRMKIEPFMTRPAWMNNSYLNILKKEEEFFEEERQYEKGVLSKNSSSNVVVENKYDEENEEDKLVSIPLPDFDDEFKSKYTIRISDDSDDSDDEANEADEADKKTSKYSKFISNYSLAVGSWADDEEDENDW